MAYRRYTRIKKFVRKGSLALVMCVATACERVHYRNNGYVSSSVRSGQRILTLVAIGSTIVEDSAGTELHRTGNPYTLLIRFSGPGSNRIETVAVDVTGRKDRRNVPAAPALIERIVPGTGPQVARLVGLSLDPHQDYDIRIRYRYKLGPLPSTELAEGELVRRFEHHHAWRFWERLMSV